MPDAGPNARGRPIINWIPLEAGEQVQAVLPVREYDEDHYVFFATRNGTVKKTPLTEFAFRLQRGKIAINLDEGDAPGRRRADRRHARHHAVRLQRQGRALRREARCARWAAPPPACAASAWPRASRCVSLIVVDGDGDILTASERGYGKRTPVDEYPRKGRGTQGVIAIKTTERNGQLVGAIQLSDHHEVLLISDGGTLVRTRAAEISQVGRNTQGVTLMRLAADEKLHAVERLDVIERRARELAAEAGRRKPRG